MYALLSQATLHRPEDTSSKFSSMFMVIAVDKGEKGVRGELRGGWGGTDIYALLFPSQKDRSCLALHVGD